MKEVPMQFNADDYNFTQVKRTNDIVIYEKTCEESDRLLYEVVRIRVATEKTFPNGTVVPEHEFYPPTARWGADGWSYDTWREVYNKFNKLVLKKEDSEQALKSLMESI